MIKNSLSTRTQSTKFSCLSKWRKWVSCFRLSSLNLISVVFVISKVSSSACIMNLTFASFKRSSILFDISFLFLKRLAERRCSEIYWALALGSMTYQKACLSKTMQQISTWSGYTPRSYTSFSTNNIRSDSWLSSLSLLA